MSETPADADVAYDEDDDEARIFSVLSGTRRRSRWRLAASNTVLTVFGRTFLDMRHAETPASAVDMRIWCVFGSVTILVPEGADVRPSGMAFLGTSDCVVPTLPVDAGFPPLDVEANVVFGRVRVRTALGNEETAAIPVDVPVRRGEPAAAAPEPAVA